MKWYKTIITALLLAAIASIFIPGHASGFGAENISNSVQVSSPPIVITSDSDYTTYATGNGSEGDPYIIENLEINAAGMKNGIFIRNAQAYAEIRNCTINNASGAGMTGFLDINAGIYVYESKNVAIINCTLSFNNNWGILSIWSTNVDVKNCILINQLDEAIRMDGTDNCTIVDNTIDICSEGILFFNSGNHTVNNNSLTTFLFEGISFNTCDNVTVNGNTMITDVAQPYSCHGLYILKVSNSTILQNTVINQSNMDTCFVSSCENLTFGYNYFEGSYQSGLMLSHVGNTSFFNNTITKSRYDGIVVDYFSFDNVFKNNSITHNQRYGFNLDEDCYSNTFVNNTFAYNGNYGGYIDSSNNNINRIYGNDFLYNNGGGVQGCDNSISTTNYWDDSSFGNYWSDWTAPDVAPQDGIVDIPYTLDGVISRADYYPLANPAVPEIEPTGYMMGIVVNVVICGLMLARVVKRVR